MVRKVGESTVEEIAGPMRSIDLRRQKLPTVDLYDNPFAQDRQLEDQSRMITNNNNPRFFENTKVDKVRSQLVKAKAPSRAIAIKAKVLNKIVREASGIHNYAMVPPPIQVTGPDLEVDDDPDSNTYVHAYAKESKQRPIICSFGHRPKSASRTFNPATMKTRLRHGEVVKVSSPNKSGFGLPLTVLKRVMKAPRLKYPNEFDDDEPLKTLDAESSFRTQYDNTQNPDVYNLFGAPEGFEGSVTGGGIFINSNNQNINQNHNSSNIISNHNNSSSNFKNRSDRDVSSGGGVGVGVGMDNGSVVGGKFKSDASWADASQNEIIGDVGDISQVTMNAKKSKKKKALRDILPPIWPMKCDIEQRPSWNTNHHQNDTHISEVFKLKASGLNEVEAMTLKERLTRFIERAGPGAETKSMFCVEKQITDLDVLHGIIKAPEKSKPIKGQVLYYDPLNGNLQAVIKLHEQEVEKKKEYWEKKAKKDAWKTVPIVDYDPQKALEKMKAKTAKMLENLELAKTSNSYNVSRINSAAEESVNEDGGFEFVHDGEAADNDDGVDGGEEEADI